MSKILLLSYLSFAILVSSELKQQLRHDRDGDWIAKQKKQQSIVMPSLADMLFRNTSHPLYMELQEFEFRRDETNRALAKRREMEATTTQIESRPDRELYYHPAPPPSKEIPCVICTGMDACSAIENLYIQEVYLPNNLDALGTCVVLEALGQRVRQEIFGPQKSFRDTPACKDIVMQYVCLFYGSNNNMYENLCLYREEITDSQQANHKIAPRPPCRSFCVQIATICANDPNFVQLCEQIECPPFEDVCTPDPKLDNQVLAANLGCDLPYDIDPYFNANSAPAGYRTQTQTLCLLLSLLLALMTFFLL